MSEVRPSVTDNARAAMHPVVTEHQIIGTQTGKQGAGQVVPEDSVLCVKCGWMRCSDYTWHLSDALAAGRAETTTATVEDAARVIDALGRHWWSTQTGETEPWDDLTDDEKANVVENAYIDVLVTPVLGLLATARTRPECR